MSKILELRLKIVKYKHLLRKTRVMVVKDHEEIVVDGEKTPFQKGVEIEIPLWLTPVMKKKGVIDLIESPISIEDIARVHFSVIGARTPADLEPLPKNFYLEAANYIKMLDEKIRQEFRAELLEEKQKAIQYLLEIMDKRLLLILQSMRSPTSIAEISSKLSEEEAILLDELREDIDAWKKSIAPTS